jgi:radical SAM/Cys-rich protein
MLDTSPFLLPTTFPPIQRANLEILQVNLGYLCNQTCQHCHVDAGPKRAEIMSRQTVNDVIGYLDGGKVRAIDLTGGAPEMNPHFRYLVESAHQRGVGVIDRCNLSVLEEPGHEESAEFLARHQVEVVASLPCYLEENVDQQRGKGVYEASVRGLRRLNSLGYGKEGSGLILNLVFNPLGPSLPPPQFDLEADYKRRLRDEHGITFNQLFTITNMPIRRFGSMLLSRGEFEGYMALLKGAYHEANLETVMCRNLISVDWQGYLYDCDFNQMLDIPFRHNGHSRVHISELAGIRLKGAPIQIAEHCYGCTAGQGSSCGGALSD